MDNRVRMFRQEGTRFTITPGDDATNVDKRWILDIITNDGVSRILDILTKEGEDIDSLEWEQNEKTGPTGRIGWGVFPSHRLDAETLRSLDIGDTVVLYDSASETFGQCKLISISLY